MIFCPCGKLVNPESCIEPFYCSKCIQEMVELMIPILQEVIEEEKHYDTHT